jgi:hypothetical protein
MKNFQEQNIFFSLLETDLMSCKVALDGTVKPQIHFCRAREKS